MIDFSFVFHHNHMEYNEVGQNNDHYNNHHHNNQLDTYPYKHLCSYHGNLGTLFQGNGLGTDLGIGLDNDLGNGLYNDLGNGLYNDLGNGLHLDKLDLDNSLALDSYLKDDSCYLHDELNHGCLFSVLVDALSDSEKFDVIK